MATVYFTASSLDGYIVDEADSLDWLTSRAIDADGPFGYQAFVKSVGALVMDVRPAILGADAPPAHHRRRASGADDRR